MLCLRARTLLFTIIISWLHDLQKFTTTVFAFSYIFKNFESLGMALVKCKKIVGRTSTMFHPWRGSKSAIRLTTWMGLSIVVNLWLAVWVCWQLACSALGATFKGGWNCFGLQEVSYRTFSFLRNTVCSNVIYVITTKFLYITLVVSDEIAPYSYKRRCVPWLVVCPLDL